MIKKILFITRMTVVFVLLLFSSKSYCQDVVNYVLDSVVYTTTLDKNNIKIKNIQGVWCFDNEKITVRDSVWESNITHNKYKLAIHHLTSDIENFTMLHLCNQCVSFTKKDKIPEDEIIMYKVLEYDNNMLRVENFLTHAVKVFVRCQ